MLRVVVVDDHAVVREGLKRIISESANMTVTAEAAGGNEAIEIVSRTPCDAVVLDISMPDRNGIEVLKELRARCPSVPVLMLSIHSEDQCALRSLRAGAAGYLTKDAAPANIVEAIRKVVRGGKYVSSSLAEKLVDFDLEGEPPHELLSDREYQVLCMIGSGKTVSQIAAELRLSVKTVSTYRARILEKLDMANNAEITRYAIKAGLVD